jgi:hypothetical protein
MDVEPMDGARAQITEVIDYARTVEAQLGEVRQRDKVASVDQRDTAEKAPTASWRRQLFGSKVANSRRG